jgi:hypothetical protein
MASRKAFQLPFAAPSRLEVEALTRAAAYFLRAATEVQSGRMARFPAERSMLDDLPVSLQAAGLLCDAVVESAGAIANRT